MWKLVSCIGLVVLLDVAFVWMMATQPDAPELARAIGPTAALPVIHEPQASEPIAIDDSVEPSEPDLNENPYQRSDDRTRLDGSRDVRSTSSPVQVENSTVGATAPAKLFQDTIIWIGRTEVPVKIESRDEAPVVSEPNNAGTIHARIVQPDIEAKAAARKRSFQSKAFSVIKKPYDWMRSVADKLH